jgi:trans-2,3-dihydro-3-hydroxyanthranilate isomerase
MKLPFYTLDVFTNRTFGGNPLAVFPNATHLPSELMQHIALEMNLSETVFIGPPETEAGTARVRIFTPRQEVPFAGHPTVGAAIFLADEITSNDDDEIRKQPSTTPPVQTPSNGELTLILEENVGPVPVEVRFKAGVPVFAKFTTALLPEHRPNPYPISDVAALIGLEESDIGGGPFKSELKIEQVSCGLEYFIIPVRTLEAVRCSSLDTARWKKMLSKSWAKFVYVVSMEAEGEGVDAHVRMYAPGSGVPEDPATGSAAAALGGYLSAADGSTEASLSWTVEQGIEMGRPSILHVEADRRHGATSAIRVGGSAVRVSRGTMEVPA